MRETDLYPAVREFLSKQGYSVKAEVGDCDVTATRGGTIVAVELKPTVTVKLLLQAAARTGAADAVYVAVPRDTPVLRSDRAGLTRLLRLLGIGLLLVDTARCTVTAALDPGPCRPSRRRRSRDLLLRQHAELVGDPNSGGSGRRGGIMTPYRQRALRIARLLRERGPMRASAVRASTGESDSWAILYRNVYGWFERTGRGTYALSPRGGREIDLWPGGGVPGPCPEPGEGVDR